MAMEGVAKERPGDRLIGVNRARSPFSFPVATVLVGVSVRCLEWWSRGSF